MRKMRNTLTLSPGPYTVGNLRDKSAALAVRLLREALEDLRDGKEFSANQMNDGGRQFFKMHPRLKALANQRLQMFAENASSSLAMKAKRLRMDSSLKTQSKV